MTARGGPGGRIPNQGKGPQAPGVGKNSKRHDLERQKTPGLGGSDLQQGDVKAMEQGQRIAPVKKQDPASPSPQRASQGGQPAQAPPSDLTDTQGIIKNRLGGTLAQQGALHQPDEELRRRGAGWVNFLTQLSAQPGASPLLRATVQSQVIRQVQDNSFGPRGGFFNLNTVDDAIEGLNNGGV